jgi:hypothetical protein
MNFVTREKISESDGTTKGIDIRDEILRQFEVRQLFRHTMNKR